jgi:hypothetical protein
MFAWNSALFRLSPVRFIRPADARNCCDAERPAKASGSNLLLLEVAVADGPALSGFATSRLEA